MDKVASNRQYLSNSCCGGIGKLGIYVNKGSGKIFYARCDGDTSTNRIKPKKVWLDKDGLICVEIELPHQYANNTIVKDTNE